MCDFSFITFYEIVAKEAFLEVRKSAQSQNDTCPGGLREKSTSCFLEKIRQIKHLTAVSRLESRKTEQITFVFPGRPASFSMFKIIKISPSYDTRSS